MDVPTGLTASYRLKRYGGKRVNYDATQPIETRVYLIRRLLADDRNSASRVQVEAFIPEHLRGGVPAYDARWKAPGILLTTASIYANRKTLTPFLDGGEFEIRFPDDCESI
ncbi:hypothetical protein ACVCII_24075 [Burkholderia glumae]